MAQVKRKAEEDPDELRRAVGEGKETKQEAEAVVQQERKKQIEGLDMIYFAPYTYNGNFADQTLRDTVFLAKAVAWFVEKVAIHPKTGKGQFGWVTQQSNLTKEGLKRLGDFTPHFLDDNGNLTEEGGRIQHVADAMMFCKWFYDGFINDTEEPGRVWLIDQSHIRKIRDACMHAHLEDKTDKMIGRMAVQLMTSYVTGNQKYYTPAHFWMMLCGPLRAIVTAFAREERDSDDGELGWSSVGVLDEVHFVVNVVPDGHPTFPFLKYITEWLEKEPPIDVIKEFVTVLEEQIINPLLEQGSPILVDNEDFLLKWNNPKEHKLKEYKVNGDFLPMLKFVLNPCVKYAMEAGLSAQMVYEGQAKDAPFSADAMFVLDMYKATHSPNVKDRIPIVTEKKTDEDEDEEDEDDETSEKDRKTLARVLGFAWMENENAEDVIWLEEDGVFIHRNLIEGFLGWLVLSHPFWCTQGRVAIIGKRLDPLGPLDRDQRLFQFLLETDIFHGSGLYGTAAFSRHIMQPRGLLKFYYDWDVKLLETNPVQVLDKNKALFEWLIKKHPDYRQKQVDAYLFDANLGTVQTDVKKISPITGDLYWGKERKNTYRAIGPVARKFRLSKPQDNNPTSGKEKQAKVSESSLPDEIYEHISTFYTQGRMLHYYYGGGGKGKRKAEGAPSSGGDGDGKETKQVPAASTAEKKKKKNKERKLEIMYFTPGDESIRKTNKALGKMVQEDMERFTEHVLVDAKTGKGKFYEDIKGISLVFQRRLADEGLKFPLVFRHFIANKEDRRKLRKDPMNIEEGMNFLRDYYKNEIQKPAITAADRVWIIDDRYKNYIIKIQRVFFPGAGGVRADWENYRWKNHSVLQVLLDYATGNKRYFTETHLWAMIYDSVDHALLHIRSIRDPEEWSRERMLAEVEWKLKSRLHLGIPLFRYIHAWLNRNHAVSSSEVAAFYSALRERLDKLYLRARNVFRATSEWLQEWHGTDGTEQRESSSANDGKKLASIAAFFLDPSPERAKDIGLDAMYQVAVEKKEAKETDYHKEAEREFALEMVPTLYSEEEGQGIKIAPENVEIFVRIVAPIEMFDVDVGNGPNGGRLVFKTDFIIGMIGWMLLSEPFWRLNDRLAITNVRPDPDVGDYDPNSPFFKMIKNRRFHTDERDEKYVYSYYPSSVNLLFPEGLRIVYSKWEFDVGVKTEADWKTGWMGTVQNSASMLEWLIRKHPAYRDRSIEAYFFETPLGMVQKWTEEPHPLTGQMYPVKERKDTYQASDPTKRTFRLPVTSKTTKDNKDNDDSQGGTKKAKVVVYPSLGPDIYKKISSFYTQGKADRLLLVDSDSDDEEEEAKSSLFGGHYCSISGVREVIEDKASGIKAYISPGDGVAMMFLNRKYTHGKVIDQAWCERTDEDTDIRTYLFPGYWRLAHNAAFQAMTPKQLAFAKRLVRFVADHLPCDNCRGNFNKKLETYKTPLNSMTAAELAEFLVEAHNEVNAENGKPDSNWTVAKARKHAREATDADLPGFWDLLHRMAAQAKFNWDRDDILSLARLISELTLDLHPTWYGNLVQDLSTVQKVQDMFAMTVYIHNNKVQSKGSRGQQQCKMTLQQAQLIYLMHPEPLQP
jgi:hypothetical protein